NVHPTIFYDPSNPSSKKAASEAFEEICRQAIAMGGTITGEHGIGIQKVKLLKEQMESHDGIEALRLMKETKRLFDPKGIMTTANERDAAVHSRRRGYMSYHQATRAPENRPSVIRATVWSNPCSTMAAVTASISPIPGPPFGPS